MPSAVRRALDLGSQIESFPIKECGPSDDPDKQTAYVTAFVDLVKPFVAAVRRIGDSELLLAVNRLNTDSTWIDEAYRLRADLQGVIDHLREFASPNSEDRLAKSNAAFLDDEVLTALRNRAPDKFDLAKLIRYCEELNDAYSRGNFLSCALLIRAVMNHVPPLFGQQTFAQTVAHSSRSVKAILGRLEDGARLIGDLHNHSLIRQKEALPTKHQVEPFKAPFEILIQEILAELG